MLEVAIRQPKTFTRMEHTNATCGRLFPGGEREPKGKRE